MNNPNVNFCGSIPYSEVQRLNTESDIVVLVEGFSKSDIEKTRYSLSTKAADSLSSGSNILVYGSAECGLIEYMAGTGAAAVCSNPSELESVISNFINDIDYQKKNYETAIRVSEENHTLENSTKIFLDIVERVIKENNNDNQCN